MTGVGRDGGVSACHCWRETESSPEFPKIKIAQVHAANDDQCPIKQAEDPGEIWDVELVTFKKGGHGLDKDRALQKKRAKVVREIWHPSPEA